MTAWWRDAAIYQVYVRSIADGAGDGVRDGDGDGIGDLTGVRDRRGVTRPPGAADSAGWWKVKCVP
ncbi:MAG TPA: hypothetical protein VFV66_09290 [Nonomuraea sp.]|nr:hypothetical protein [Nonomuraea sp.]